MTYLESVRNNHRLPRGTYEGEWIKKTVTIKAGEDTYDVLVSKVTRRKKPVTCEVLDRLVIDIWIKGES